MPFAPAAAVVGAGLGLAGSALQANAVGDAADKANEAQRAALDKETALLSPWAGTGGSANTATTPTCSG